MGACNPEFNENGQAKTQPKADDYAYVGGKITWNSLKEGRHRGRMEVDRELKRISKNWPTVRKPLRETLGSSPSSADASGETQLRRCSQRGKITSASPMKFPSIANVPSLAVMSRGGNPLPGTESEWFLFDDRRRGGRLGQSRAINRIA